MLLIMYRSYVRSYNPEVMLLIMYRSYVRSHNPEVMPDYRSHVVSHNSEVMLYLIIQKLCYLLYIGVMSILTI